MWQNILLNWKTSASGFAAVLTALADVLHALSAGQLPNFEADIPAIVSGIGLIVAKDSNVSGRAAR
jgi:hypothetical protein